MSIVYLWGIIGALIVSLCVSKNEKQWMMHTESTWDKEWKTGKWNYLEDVPAERARVAVIGALMVQNFAPGNKSVLDVGCGEGAIADFLTPAQKNIVCGCRLIKRSNSSCKKEAGGSNALCSCSGALV
jgi:cyclopropane fatty-acyl-phospholipid synthase-like methyltransferase